MQAKAFAAKLEAGGAGIFVACGHDSHAHHELGHGVGVLSGSVLHHDTGVGGCFEVDVVVSGTGAYYDFELVGGCDDGCVDDVGAHYQCVDVGNGCVKLVGALIFLKKDYCVAGLFEYAAHLCYCGGRERFLCGDEYFHSRGSYQWVASKSCMASTSTLTLSMGRAL